LRKRAEGEEAKQEGEGMAHHHGRQLILEVVSSIWSAAEMTLEFIS
jgi:hypothetical protein